MNFASILDGKLLLTSEIPLSAPTITYLQRTQQLIPTDSITNKFHKKHCQRCGNRQQHQFAIIDCSRCHQSHWYCRHCVETGRVLACDPLWRWRGNKISWLFQANPCDWQGELTPTQQQAANTLTAAVITKQKEQMIWAVCGSGKSEMLFPAITYAIRERKRICLATPRADVVRELFPRLCQAFPHTEIEALYADSEDRTGTGQLVITTTHQLIRYQQAFDLMIIDEVDAFPFHHDPALPKLTTRACRADATTIYLTATPRRDHQQRIKRKQLPVVFVPIRFHLQPLPVPVLKLEWQLRQKLKQQHRSQQFEKFRHSRSKSRQLLIFVPTIALTQAIASQYQATAVHAEDPARKEKVEQFRQKQIDTLVTTTILERGVTFPSVDVVILDAGHEVFDEAALIQIAGRAGRSPDDPTGHVLFIHQGKTEAIEAAVKQINMMNKKGVAL
ncbi:DEAD/DEAH box helicase [Gracilibacillus alcaliphilus]|uniref:DEAD/DEAH box helicase n=1 Tax=Gracilibacillus alcaliphilus TaxID=1401441 RepID=UPI00195C2831|nr:helicase-related protein [Gracilibacillus alcaliphilus]MBM7679514.1 competence protein ComFA [Gracilibacillus alcaliphilus]